MKLALKDHKDKVGLVEIVGTLVQLEMLAAKEIEVIQVLQDRVDPLEALAVLDLRVSREDRAQ